MSADYTFEELDESDSSYMAERTHGQVTGLIIREE